MENEKQDLILRAAALEGKQLFVKAAELYLQAGEEGRAAQAYEKGCAYDKAIALFLKMGKKEDAARCGKMRDAASTGGSWMDMQADFQKDAGNPY
jgi:hypothetical protein